MATYTLYPDASFGATTVDGFVGRAIAGTETLATIRSGAGTDSLYDANPDLVYIGASTTINQFNEIDRGILTFDTSSIVDSDTITSVVLSLYGNAKSNGLGSPDLHIAGATPTVDNNVEPADYNLCQTTSFGSISYASFTNAVYNDITLNASGIANVSKTGISRFSVQLSWDINNSFTGSWSSGLSSFFKWVSADGGGAVTGPKLTVTTTAGATGNMAGNMMLLGVG